MSTLRSLRLLGAVEAGTVSGPQLQTFLTDAGRASEFSVLLTSRGQSRRMAGSPLTMSVIVVSPAATDIIFRAATTETSAACKAVVTSAIAMSAVSNSTPSLFVLGGNSVAWSLFKDSIHYETNIKNVIANFAGVNPTSYLTAGAIMTDPDSMANVAAAPYAMKAVVASPATVSVMASSTTAMAVVAANTTAIGIVTATTSIMGIIANSSIAMTEIVSHSSATASVAASPGAIIAVAESAAAWTIYKAGPFFAANLATALANLIGVSPSAYPTLSSIIADSGALGKVASNKSAVEALASNSAALNTLATSPNIGIILSSAIAMGVIGPNTSAMGSFLSSSGSWSGLFGSSVAKGYIVKSTELVDLVASNSALITYLGTLSATATASGIPDGVVGAYQTFAGIPSKVLVLSAKEVGIAATFSPYKFGGSVIAGSTAGTLLSLTSVANLAHVAGYTGMTWDLQGIGVTAATLPIIKYVDMT
jgi:hypothetical protein